MLRLTLSELLEQLALRGDLNRVCKISFQQTRLDYLTQTQQIEQQRFILVHQKMWVKFRSPLNRQLKMFH